MNVSNKGKSEGSLVSKLFTLTITFPALEIGYLNLFDPLGEFGGLGALSRSVLRVLFLQQETSAQSPPLP
jgi:hypothetical protein